MTTSAGIGLDVGTISQTDWSLRFRSWNCSETMLPLTKTY